MADGRIDIGTFNSSVDRYKKKITTLRSEQTANKDKSSGYDEYLKKGIDLLSNFGKFYSNADIHGKRRLIGSTFPENLIFSKKNCRTASLNKGILQ